jgi:hypothetical protein
VWTDLIKVNSNDRARSAALEAGGDGRLGSKIGLDAGLLLFPELDVVLGFHELMGKHVVDSHTGA